MTIKKLINGNGQVIPGLLDEPVEEINYLDYDLRTVMDRPRSKLARRWRFTSSSLSVPWARVGCLVWRWWI